jgi:hypothetical protein
MKLKCVMFCLFLISVQFLKGQDSIVNKAIDTTSKPEKNYKILLLPLFFYTPETKFGIGVASLVTFKFKKDSKIAKPSNVELGFAYTQYKQVLLYPFNFGLKMENTMSMEK